MSDQGGRRWRVWLFAGVGVAGAALGVDDALLDPLGGRPQAQLSSLAGIEVLLLQIPLLLVATAVHELGHALAARAVGFQVVRWRVGPIAADVAAGGWRVRFVPGTWLGGEVSSDPLTPANLRARHALMIACGPAAHLALALLLVAAAAVHGGAALWVSAATVGLAGLWNLVPLEHSRSRWSDGRWLLAWLTSPGRATQRAATGTLQLALRSARRPRDWDEHWTVLAAAGRRQPADRVEVVGRTLAYAWALDRGDLDAAATQLMRAFAGRRLLPPAATAGLAVETAFFVARFRGDAGLATRLLETEARQLRPALAADLERAWAAAHLAAGRRVEALAACDRALRSLERSRASLTQLYRELVLAMREDALRLRPPESEPPAGQQAISAP